MNKVNKKKTNNNRHKFLIEQYFDGKVEGHVVKQVGNWVLIKQCNNGNWEVAIWEADVHKRILEGYQKGLFNA